MRWYINKAVPHVQCSTMSGMQVIADEVETTDVEPVWYVGINMSLL